MQRRDLDEIAEHVVVADLERFDPGGFGISRLQTGNHLAAAVAQAAMLIEIGIGAAPDEAAVARIEGKRFVQRPRQRLLDLRRRGGQTFGNAHQLARQAEHLAGAQQLRGKVVSGHNRRTDRAEIARPPSSKRQPRQRAGQVGSGLQRVAQIVPQARLVGEIGDSVETRVQDRRIGQRTAEPAGQLARAGGGDGAVDGGEQTSGAGALVRADQLEIGAGRGVDDEKTAGTLLARRAEQRRLADLGDLNIGEQPGERGQLGAGEFAEGVERRHAETGLQRAFAAHGIEMGARARRQSRAGLLDLAAQHRIAGQIVADQHLARLEPGKLAGEIARAGRRGDQLAGRDVERGQCIARLAVVFRRRAEQRGEEVVGAGIEQGLLGERAGGDQPHHVAAHHRLGTALPGLGRVLDLLAHRDPPAGRDQALEIVVGGMDRHAAHRDVGAQMLAALGQGDAERARGDFGVLEEQLVEIAHAVEQETVGIGRLDLQILGDHGRGGRRLLARGKRPDSPPP